eukprot:GEMP01010402.1.p1 GENE.GEMP01010402.1~~GEMP01010402.1.p1  ORF type:complete len:514 (+),score=157.84 GEMP01010402.1:340-1881(+)
MVPPLSINTADFPEFDPKVTISSPRSLRACSEEGVAPQDLVYKTLDAFAEKGLSPRLIKLRYDFFEAKRRDLLCSTRRARDRIIESANKDAHFNNLKQVAEYSGVNEGYLLALQSDTLKRERMQLLKSQQLQKGWLRNTLINELRQLEGLERADQKLTEAGNKEAEQLQERARRTKEINERRAAEEEQKRLELLAQEKYEKQVAKEEFARQQHAQELLMEKQREEDRQRLERNRVEQEKQLVREREKEEKRQREHELQQQKLEELMLADERRIEILEQKTVNMQIELANKKIMRDVKFKTSQRNLAVVESKKRDEYQERQVQEIERDRKLAFTKALQQEEGAKKSFHLMMKRKQISEDAQRKFEDRRQALTESRIQIEHRLLIHEHKKNRYLDFKRELDGLKEKNKEINVARQRRKEEHLRGEVEDLIEKKTAKIDAVKQERDKLWGLRRSAVIASQAAREDVKTTVMAMKVRSKPQPKILEKQVNSILANELFSPKVLQMSHSMPRLPLPMA